MLYSLNNAQTNDTYNAGDTLSCPGSVAQTLIVTGAAIYVKVWVREEPLEAAPGVAGDLRGGKEQDEMFLTPGYFDRGWHAEKIQVRSAIAGIPAQVTIHAR